MDVNLKKSRSFKTPAAYGSWLKKNHAVETELWIRMYRKGSGRPSIDWEQAVIESLAWGWIDGIVKSFDEISFHQRFTPRRPKSNWSQKNREHVERLISQGRMQPAGMAHVESAMADGRWELAYAGQSNFVIHAEFIQAVSKNPKAQKQFKTLDRKSLFAIYIRLHTAKRPETRTRRIEAMIEKLAKGEPLL
jgi:uncharacterized protein YdeI (YjbR/CyaY-like superfamily)